MLVKKRGRGRPRSEARQKERDERAAFQRYNDDLQRARERRTDIEHICFIGEITPQVDAATRGKLVFEKRCTGCHAMKADREGPRLAGVFGRKAGSVPGFDYSTGLKNSGITWNEATLEKWLNGPEMMVPDTRMDFYVAKARERSDLIAYLKQDSEAIR